MNPLTATEARQLTDAKPEHDRISNLMEVAYARIKEAARLGKSFIADPTVGLRQNVTAEQRAAVHEILEAAGYKITQRNPDGPHHPSQTVITW